MVDFFVNSANCWQTDVLVSFSVEVNPKFLPPANEVCEGYVFTGVCLSTRGCLTHCMLGYTPLTGTPPGEVHSPGQTPPGRYTPAWSDTPASECWDTNTPPAQCMLGYGQQAGSTHPTGMHSCLL